MKSNHNYQLTMLQKMKNKNECQKIKTNEHVVSAYYSSLGTLARIINASEDKTNEKN